LNRRNWSSVISPHGRWVFGPLFGSAKYQGKWDSTLQGSKTVPAYRCAFHTFLSSVCCAIQYLVSPFFLCCDSFMLYDYWSSFCTVGIWQMPLTNLIEVVFLYQAILSFTCHNFSWIEDLSVFPDISSFVVPLQESSVLS
jgi:hypothetical protein